MSQTGNETNQEDPVYRNSLVEARFILGLWACCFVYTVTVCYLFGYENHQPLPGSTGPAIAKLFGPLESMDRDPANLGNPLGLGIPDWVFYGIAIPWGVCTVISVLYCFVLFKEDDLGSEEGKSENP